MRMHSGENEMATSAANLASHPLIHPAAAAAAAYSYFDYGPSPAPPSPSAHHLHHPGGHAPNALHDMYYPGGVHLQPHHAAYPAHMGHGQHMGLHSVPPPLLGPAKRPANGPLDIEELGHNNNHHGHPGQHGQQQHSSEEEDDEPDVKPRLGAGANAAGGGGGGGGGVDGIGRGKGVGGVGGGVSGVGGDVGAAKKTKGRVKIKMEFIDNKLRRYTTFSKRKTGIMKKAYELSTLTGTQVMLLVASETGHVYTFATRKLQPMITSEAGKTLIQTCLNSPDPVPITSSADQRMSATGYEETELTYTIADDELRHQQHHVHHHPQLQQEQKVRQMMYGGQHSYQAAAAAAAAVAAQHNLFATPTGGTPTVATPTQPPSPFTATSSPVAGYGVAGTLSPPPPPAASPSFYHPGSR